MISERLSALRRVMEQKKADMYLVPASDFHESEYVTDYFKAREFLTGFTGSAGTAVITAKEAGLWTDGRYFVQAKEQLPDEIRLYQMGEDGVPDIEEYVENHLKEHGCLAFDGRVVNAVWGEKLKKAAEKIHGTIKTDEDLLDGIWKDRPALSCEPVWLLDEKYSGKKTSDKLSKVREEMKKKKADIHLMTSLCDIAWLLNVRGGDISYVPVPLSFLALTEEECIWFVQSGAVDEEVRDYVRKNHITVREYREFYEYVKKLEGKTVLLDRGAVSCSICSSIPDSCRIMDEPDVAALMKAVKNKTEIDNIRKAHIKDAVAVCRFMYWLKTNAGSIPMTELSAAEYLEGLRKEQEGFLEPSFETISAYKEHGAIVHYAPVPETDASVEGQGFLLVDSGGHYLEGTTDITRTFAVGAVTEEMKTDYTLVCAACLNLAATCFLYGCTGKNLDLAARAPFWEKGLDYKHGTGHGVGYLLSVHEGPNAFRWRKPEAVMEEGMVTTDEPGLYKEGKYGIRLENELLCRKGEKNEYGQFMYFENLTFVPYDLDAIAAEKLTDTERKRLNEYHAAVYSVVSPFLRGEELAWLKDATRKV